MTSGDTGAVLGRYSPAATDDELIEVRLIDFPLQIFEQARQRHDELMREFALLALRPPTDRPGHEVPQRMLELVELLGRRYGAAGDRSDAVRDAAIERGEERMDLTYHLPRAAGPAMRQLSELMIEADEYCANEQLLTLAASPVERHFRQWFIDQFTKQLEGEPPEPYRPPTD